MTIRDLILELLLTNQDLDKVATIVILEREWTNQTHTEWSSVKSYQTCLISRVRHTTDQLVIEKLILNDQPITREEPT